MLPMINFQIYLDNGFVIWNINSKKWNQLKKLKSSTAIYKIKSKKLGNKSTLGSGIDTYVRQMVLVDDWNVYLTYEEVVVTLFVIT